MYGALTTIAAVYDARRTGKGRFIDLAMLDGSFSLLAEQAARYFVTGVVPSATGNSSNDYAPYGVFQSSDGKAVSVAVRTDDEFHALCDALSRNDLKEDASFISRKDRVKNRASLEKEVSDELAKRTAEEGCRIISSMVATLVPSLSYPKPVSTFPTAAINI